MRTFCRLWRDETGLLLSAEAVVVGTVAVVGLTTGLTVVSKAVNEELKDVAFAIRSLDQSYSIPASEGCGAWVAGSSFTQEPVEDSLKTLREEAEKAEAAEAAEAAEKSQSNRLEEKAKKAQKKVRREAVNQ